MVDLSNHIEIPFHSSAAFSPLSNTMSDLKELSNLQKYNGKEYNLWKFQAQAYLDGRNFLGIVDGTEVMPVLPFASFSSTPILEIQFGRTLFSEVSPIHDESMSPTQREEIQNAILEFKKKDKQAFSILIQLVDKPILHQIVNCKTSKEVWDKLALIHERTVVQSLYQLQESYYNLRLGDYGDMATFIGDLEMINSQIEELGTKSFSEAMVISKMLSNLPVAYDTFQTMWKTVAPEQQTLAHLQAWLLDEERSIRKRQFENSTHQASAFHSRSPQPYGDSGRSRSNFPPEEIPVELYQMDIEPPVLFSHKSNMIYTISVPKKLLLISRLRVWKLWRVWSLAQRVPSTSKKIGHQSPCSWFSFHRTASCTSTRSRYSFAGLSIRRIDSSNTYTTTSIHGATS